MKELRPEVQDVISNWYKNTNYDVIQTWEQDDTWFLVIRHYPNEDAFMPGRPSKLKLDFVRIFPSYRIKDGYHLSIDNTVVV